MDGTRHGYGHFCRPGLITLLEAVGLDAVYERGEGDYLFQRKGTDLIKVLDLVGGFGANLFGHNHPEIVAEMQALLQARVPVMAQASCRGGAAQLAEALCRRLGDYVVIFTNSGTETVEAALKHAFRERGRPRFWAVKHAFHGKTTGSLQLTWSYRTSFAALGPSVDVLDPWSPDTWEHAGAHVDEISAAFIEPILGEGGVRPLPAAFVDWLVATCREAGVPLVVDEIQCGMGRTGSFLASDGLGITPDYLCLSKSLGGGLVKIGALLIRRDRFVEAFSIEHTSTFAEDDLSCLVALKALEVLEREDVPARCARLGDRLLNDLEDLRLRYPDVLREIRGKGLMIGVQLADQAASPSYALRLISNQKYLSYVAAAYLLNVHRIRVAPTLSQPFTIRIEPSAFIAEHELDRFVEALEELCQAVRALDIFHLTGFQIGRKPAPIVDYNVPRHFTREAPQTPNSVAFLAHLVLPEHISLWDPSLQAIPHADIDRYMTKLLRPLEPEIFDQIHVRSNAGAVVHLSWIDLYLTSEQIVRARREGKAGWIRDQIESAVVLAREAGCRVLGLGGFTSILTGNGLRVRTNTIGLTTGNALTIGMGLLALQRAAREKDIDLESAPLAIVGATGNIARTYAVMMAPLVPELILIVHTANDAKVHTLIDEIRSAAPKVRIRISRDIEELRRCPLIVAASSSADALIGPEHLASGPVVICDISLPADVDASVGEQRPDVMVINGGIVELPSGNQDFRIGGLALDPGHVYACVGETLLMGLEGMTTHGSYGTVTPPQVSQALRLAEKHGFKLGQFKMERFTA
jgi:acetylornithine/succinyldiaminopimelate/putrescine aminotransferase/predicted amino acid dehydrogenase